MSRISVFSPVRSNVSLRDAIHQLFEDSVLSLPYTTAPAARGQEACSTALDVVETEDSYIVTASLPGVDKDAVEIEFHGGTLTLRTSLPTPPCPEGGRWLLRERFSGEVTRSLSLPLAVDADRATASYHDGVLVLTLPKSETLKPRTIKISSN